MTDTSTSTRINPSAVSSHPHSGSPGPVADDTEQRVRQRIRALRQARGWSLDELSRRTLISPSTLSRIETGRRRVALDQLAPIARALATTIDDLVDVADEADVVIRPRRCEIHGNVVWPLTREQDASGRMVSKVRMEPNDEPVVTDVHPGRDWFYVLEGTVRLVLGGRERLVHAGEAAEFSTMTPHWIGAHGGPVELLAILDREGERAHLGADERP
jgi:transcriptional regulator with XRE-family HTH domain